VRRRERIITLLGGGGQLAARGTSAAAGDAPVIGIPAPLIALPFSACVFSGTG